MTDTVETSACALPGEPKPGRAPVCTATSSGPATPVFAGTRALTQAMRRGDEQAFACFYDRYSLRLYKHLLLLAKGNESDAREVLQTVVVKLAKRCDVFDDETRLWSWLCRLARNAYIDHYRARQRGNRLLPLDALAQELAVTGPEEHRWTGALDEALEQLAPDERELIRAAHVDGRPLQELATASGQTYKAVESRLGRLRQKLKTRLLHLIRHEEQS